MMSLLGIVERGEGAAAALRSMVAFLTASVTALLLRAMRARGVTSWVRASWERP